jgi:hypothetical protein
MLARHTAYPRGVLDSFLACYPGNTNEDIEQ